jgi:hypothetical protein
MLENSRNRSDTAPVDDRQPVLPDPADWDDLVEAGEEDVPTVVLYVVAALLLLSFTLYLVVGGGHSHFH